MAKKVPVKNGIKSSDDRLMVQFLLTEEQTLLSKQRTAMSFMRTGLAFISVGIAVLAIIAQLYLKILGGILVGLGFILIYRAFRKIIDYRKRTEKLKALLKEKGYDYYEHLA